MFGFLRKLLRKGDVVKPVTTDEQPINYAKYLTTRPAADKYTAMADDEINFNKLPKLTPKQNIIMAFLGRQADLGTHYVASTTIGVALNVKTVSQSRWAKDFMPALQDLRLVEEVHMSDKCAKHWRLTRLGSLYVKRTNIDIEYTNQGNAVLAVKGPML